MCRSFQSKKLATFFPKINMIISISNLRLKIIVTITTQCCLNVIISKFCLIWNVALGSILLTLSLPRMPLIDFTLSNARRFYLSMGNPTGVKGLTTARFTQKLVLSPLTLSLPRVPLIDFTLSNASSMGNPTGVKGLKCHCDQKINSYFSLDFKNILTKHWVTKILSLDLKKIPVCFNWNFPI